MAFTAAHTTPSSACSRTMPQFALPPEWGDLLLTNDDCKVTLRLRLLLSPVLTLPIRCVSNHLSPRTRSTPSSAQRCARSSRFAGTRWWCGSSSRPCIGMAVVHGPTHIGQVDLRICIGDLCADGDVHIHNPTYGNNTDKTSSNSFRWAPRTPALDPELKEFTR